MNREELGAHLEATRITGEVATPRENNLLHIQRFLAGDRGFDFGVKWTRGWDQQSVFDLMVSRVGINPDPDFASGQDTIDTALCLGALDRFAETLGAHVAAGHRILFASGHPAGMAPAYASLAAALDPAQVVVGPPIPTPVGGDARLVNGVWLWHQHGGLPHTHFSEPMDALLDSLGEADQPGLVVADHGWAGAAGTRGLETIGFADCNDPALFVAEAQGQVAAVVPLDDDIVTEHYVPMTHYILERAGVR